jgi:putative sterol carrier protein
MSDADIKPAAPRLDEYLRDRIAPRYRQLVTAAEQRLAAAQRDVDDLRGATGTIAWEVTGSSPTLCYVNIAHGEMTVADRPQAEPFMTVSQTETDWQRFTGGMGGLFGGDPRRPLGRARIDRVRAIKGTVRFVLTGLSDGGSWTCILSFGAGPRPAEPQSTVTLAAETVTKVQSGQLDPQMAFMQGQVKLSGDPGLAMQVGVALFM